MPRLAHYMVGCLFSASLSVTSLVAQVPYHVTRTPAQILAEYRQEGRNPNGLGAASADVTHLLVHHSEYNASEVRLLLDGLEQVALSSEPSWLRADAALRIAIPGSRHDSQPLPTIFERLKRVYQRSNDPLVRLAAVGTMANLDERQAAIPFLVEVASSQDSVDSGGLAGKALTALMLMGDEGRAALKRLHDSRAVQAPELVLSLEVAAKNNYRLPERRK